MLHEEGVVKLPEYFGDEYQAICHLSSKPHCKVTKQLSFWRNQNDKLSYDLTIGIHFNSYFHCSSPPSKMKFHCYGVGKMGVIILCLIKVIHVKISNYIWVKEDTILK